MSFSKNFSMSPTKKFEWISATQIWLKVKRLKHKVRYIYRMQALTLQSDSATLWFQTIKCSNTLTT